MRLKASLRSIAMRAALLGVATIMTVTLGGDDSLAQSRKKQRELLQKIAQNLKLITGAPDDSWRKADPENILLMDLPTGTVLIEIRPDFAPIHAARVRELVREGFYDGLSFHRVIEGFVAQGGDPQGDGSGGSNKPNIEAEFSLPLKTTNKFAILGRDRIAAQVGHLEGLPVASQPPSLDSFLIDGQAQLWGIHCPGTLSMARASDPNSANSQFFFVIGDARLSLDSRYSVWGWVVDGFRHSRRISRGEPPTRPTPIVRVRVAADVPDEERPDVEIFRTEMPAFKEYLEKSGKINDGLVRDMCDIRVPVRINGEVKL